MYERAKDVLKLAILMQGSATGLSLDDIGRAFNIGRRTAERLRDAVDGLFGGLELRHIDEAQIRYWSLPPARLQLLNATAEELAHLESAATLLRQQNRPDAAASLESVGAKLRAALGPRGLTRVEPDLELLIQAEGLAMRPGPRLKLDPAILATLRRAILESAKIRIRYRTRGAGGISWHRICPYGFLYGTRPYLVAFSRNPEILDFRTYRLSNIMEIEDTGECFEREADFSLDAYARRSFGVFQEPPFDVAWKFTPEAAGDAREYVFHPDQTTEDLPDGSLIVRFRAGGAREMAWHLYTWADGVEVLEPVGFWEEVGAQSAIKFRPYSNATRARIEMPMYYEDCDEARHCVGWSHADDLGQATFRYFDNLGEARAYAKQKIDQGEQYVWMAEWGTYTNQAGNEVNDWMYCWWRGPEITEIEAGPLPEPGFGVPEERGWGYRVRYFSVP